MGGPVHYIAVDGTGMRVALSYGSDVAIVDQYTICEPNFLVDATNRADCDSYLGERKKPSRTTLTTGVG